MKIIYKPDDGRRTIAEAKRLILDALPATDQVNVYAEIGQDGDVRWDGPSRVEAVTEPMATGFITKAIIGAMNEGLIRPRVTFNPAFTDYKGSESDDEHFGISHKELEALAEQFDCRVVVGKPPPAPAHNVGHQAWQVRKPQRFTGYTAPLHRLLSEAHRADKPRPTARDVLEAWRTNPPAEIAQVLTDSFDYYDSQGDTKPADLKALGQAIKRMTNAR